MHIADGVLSAPVLLGGAAAAAAGVGVGLRRLEHDRLPQVAVLSSAFFVATLIHVPGPFSVHLTLNGLVGVILGWAAFPAILIALALQAVLFGHGGLTALGVNAFAMAAPAVLCGLLFGRGLGAAGRGRSLLQGFGAGTCAVLLSAYLVRLALLAAGDEFRIPAAAVLAAHVPLAVVEGAITASAVLFLQSVKPEVLDFRLGPAVACGANDA